MRLRTGIIRPRTREPAPGRRPAGARGHGLLDLLVALALLALLLLATVATWMGPTWFAFDPLAGPAPDLLPIEGLIRRLVVELREATRLVFPAPGSGPHDGLAFVDPRGLTVLYHVEPPVASGSPATLVRVDLDPRRVGREAITIRLLGGLRHFRACVAPAAPGKQPSLVDLDLAVEVLSRGGRPGRVVNIVTSVFPRNREAPVPDDLFPAGTPLVEPAAGP